MTEPESLPAALGLGRIGRRRAADLQTAVRERFGAALPPEETDRLARLAELVRATRGICFDELCRAADLPYAEVARGAGLLEEEGFIRIDVLQRCTINAKNA